MAFEHRETTTSPLPERRQFPCLNNNVIIWLTGHNLQLLESASARCARCFVWPCSDRRWRNTDI